MTLTSFGASVGRGPVYCALVELDDGRIVDQQVRAIDPGSYGIDSLGRRGDLLTSGFDLLSQQRERPVDSSGVVTHSRRDLLAVRLGAHGPVRGADVVREPDALLRALDERGAIARYEQALIVDLAAAGLRTHTVVNSAIVGESRAPSIAFDGTEPTRSTIAAAADFVSAAIDDAHVVPEALTLVGVGAQHASVVAAITAVANEAGAEVIAVDEPEALTAIGAALLAADRRAAGGKPATVVGGRLGALTGHSVGLTAAVFPILALAILTAGVLAATYATSAIWTSGEKVEQAPTSSLTALSEQVTGDAGAPAVSSSPLAAPSTGAAPRSTMPATAPAPIITPTMTTFAPVPSPMTSTQVQSPSQSSTPTQTTTQRVPGSSAPLTSVPPSNPSGGSHSPGTSGYGPPSTTDNPIAPSTDRAHELVRPSSPVPPATTTAPSGPPAVTAPAP